jgi:hypothetical protein
MSAAPLHRGAPIRSISAILPAYNEAGNLAPIALAVLDALSDVVPAFELILVDDGSTDGTRRVADELAASHSEVRVVHHAKRCGYGSAVRAGLGLVTKQYVFIVDADRQYDAAELARLVQWDDVFDIVAGFRLRRADPVPRRILGFGYRWLARLAFGLSYRDINCGFKLVRASVLKRLELSATGAAIHTEMFVRARELGSSVREVGVHHVARRSGENRGGRFAVLLRAALELLALRRALTKQRRSASSARAAAAGAQSVEGGAVQIMADHKGDEPHTNGGVEPPSGDAGESSGPLSPEPQPPMEIAVHMPVAGAAVSEVNAAPAPEMLGAASLPEHST